MSDRPLTLKHFFCADPDAPIAESCNMASVREAVESAGNGLPPLSRKAMMKNVAGALDQFFQIGLDDILESAWDRVAAVRDIKAASRAEPVRPPLPSRSSVWLPQGTQAGGPDAVSTSKSPETGRRGRMRRTERREGT